MNSTDNIPGVPGIGPKTAAQLLEEYGDLDTLFAHLDDIKQQKRRENLIAFADKADLTRELVTLKDDVPLGDGLDDLTLEPTDGPQLVAFLKAMEFSSLTRRVAETTDTDAAAIEPASVDVDTGAMHGPDLDAAAGAKKGGQSDAPGSRAPAATAP